MQGQQRLPHGVVFAVLIVLGVSLSALAQETKITRKDVPPAVLSAFSRAYPNATIKGYAKEMDKGQLVYEIESMEGNIHRDATYSADGKLVAIEESIDLDDLPPGVKAALDKKLGDGKILRAEKVTKGNVVTYEFQIQRSGKTSELIFDPSGNEAKI